MTIATPGTNTSVELDWTTTEVPDGRVRHFAVRAPWMFCVTEYPAAAKSRNTELVAHHPDGRGGTTLHAGADHAKAYALTRLHPSEAMVWLTDDVPLVGSVHTASWGHLYFAAVTTDDGQLRFGYRVDGDLSDRVMVLPDMEAVREAAQDVLTDHYGPLRPVVDVPLPEVADSPAERLSGTFDDLLGHDAPDEYVINEALRAAGLRLEDTTPLHRGIADPVTRLSRALYAAHRIELGYDDVTELLRRAGLTLS